MTHSDLLVHAEDTKLRVSRENKLALASVGMYLRYDGISYHKYGEFY